MFMSLVLKLRTKSHKKRWTIIPRDAYVLEFLDLPSSYKEKDLRKQIVSHLKDFILEFGKYFSSLVNYSILRIISAEDGAWAWLLVGCFLFLIQLLSSTLTWPVDRALQNRGLISLFPLLSRYSLSMIEELNEIDKD